MENLEINRERVLRREEPFLNKTKLILDRWMKRPSQWTVAIRRLLMNRRLPLMAIRSLMNGRMRSHLVKKVRLRFNPMRWILIVRSRLNRRSTDRVESQPYNS